VPALVDVGVAEAEIPLVVAQAQRASSMQGNPIRLSDAQLMEVLAEAIRTPA
jgi:alcohol dehydrogenase class IV